MTTASAEVLIRSLQNPAVYPHPVDRVELIETHISWVLLAGEYAYKLKKPLDLGFLDFSTLEKRLHCCREEIRLNSRLAPDIYLNVIEIGGSAEHPRPGGNGAAIDYAVKMRRFDPALTFDRLLFENRLDAGHIAQTARLIAAFHNCIPRAPTSSEFGQPAAVMRPVRENFSQIRRLGIEQPDQLASLETWSEIALQRLSPKFEQRRLDGFIRECHGDLHMGNIVQINGRPVPFDGIEFNPGLYWIDVINEAAFPVMDLCGHDRYDLAYRFLNDYLQHTGDYRGLALLPFYLVYRAMVRAKVSAILACQPGSEARRNKATEDYRRYLKLAESFTRPTSPRLLLMHGVSGSGKSWLSDRMLERLPAVRIRSDVERKRLFGADVKLSEPSTIGEGMYGTGITDLTYRHLLELAAVITNAGFSVIVDATFLEKGRRRPFFELAERAGLPLAVIHTVAGRETLERRLAERAGRPDNVSDADIEVLQHQLQTGEKLSEQELNYTYRIDTADDRHLSGLWNFLDDL